MSNKKAGSVSAYRSRSDIEYPSAAASILNEKHPPEEYEVCGLLLSSGVFHGNDAYGAYSFLLFPHPICSFA